MGHRGAELYKFKMWKQEDISTVKSTSQGCTRARTSGPAQPFDCDRVVGDEKQEPSRVDAYYSGGKAGGVHMTGDNI